MKLRKLLSALCATALLISALPAASAVETESLSEYAGKVLPVLVVEETKNGLTSRMIKVSIPEGATRTEEDALVYSAIFKQSVGTTRSVNETPYLIFDAGDETFHLTSTPQFLGGGTPIGTSFNKLYKIMINFDFVRSDTSSVEIGFQIRTNIDGVVDTGTWKYIKIDELDGVTGRVSFLTESDYPAPGNDGIEVYAKTKLPGTYADIDNCFARGFTR